MADSSQALFDCCRHLLWPLNWLHGGYKTLEPNRHPKGGWDYHHASRAEISVVPPSGARDFLSGFFVEKSFFLSTGLRIFGMSLLFTAYPNRSFFSMTSEPMNSTEPAIRQASLLTPDFIAEADELVSHYPVSKRSASLPLLHLWQNHFGFVDESGIEWIAAIIHRQPCDRGGRT